MIRSSSSRGTTVLVTVIILGAILLVLGISIAFVGQTELKLTGDEDLSSMARSFASACVEEGIQRVRRDPSYSGGALAFGPYSCDVTVSGAGTARTVTGESTVREFTKTVEAQISRRQNVAGTATGWYVDSWREVDP